MRFNEGISWDYDMQFDEDQFIKEWEDKCDVQKKCAEIEKIKGKHIQLKFK